MYSILLVDDEKSIREHLTKAIPFEEHGFTVRNTAHNGREALEKLPAVRPDLILLDVRMPVMDGLEFLRHLRRSEYAGTQVVMLSGYNEFEYAKEAMKYGVKAYLNKPADEEEILPLLDRMHRELDEYRREKEKTAVRESMKLFNRLYNGSAIDRNVFRGYTFMTCVVLRYTGSAEKENLHSVIQECLVRQLGDTDNYQFRVRGSQYSYLLPPDVLEPYENEKGALAGKLSEELKREGLDCAFLFDSHVFESSRDTFREDLSNHTYEMLTELFFSGGDVLDYCPGRYKTGGELFLESKYLEELKKQIESLDGKEAVRIVEGLMEAVREERVGLEYIQEITFRIYYLLADELSKQRDGRQGDSFLPRPDWMEQPCFVPFPQWREQLSSLIAGGVDLIGRSSREANPRICKDVLEYIRCHYMEQISLKQAADRFFVNAAYLGRVFQRTTGVGFKEYVNRIRISEAKKLLLQTDRLIYEIAAQVGFTESSYFIVKFTQEVGKSPTEYRNVRAAQSDMEKAGRLP